MKKLLKIVIAVVVVLLIAVAVAWWRIDAIAKTALEKGGTYALGVQTTVDTVSVSLLNGTVGLAGLQVANPDGFDSAPYLMHTGDFDLAISPGTLMSDTVEIPLISLDSLDLYILKNSKGNNISPILDHLKQFKSSDQTPEENTGTSKKFIIKKLAITNITAHIDVPPLGNKTVKVPDIVLENVTQDNAQGMAMDEVMARVFPMITAAAIQSITDLPGDLTKTLTSDLSGVADNLGGAVGQLIKDPGKLLGNLGEGAGKAVDDVTKGAGKAVEDTAKGVGDAIGNILGGNKDKDTDKQDEEKK